MKFYKKKIILFLLLSAIYSCDKNNCSKNVGFVIDSHLFDKIRIEGKTYCTLVNESLMGNEKSILQLSKVNVDGGASYQHGAILIEVIDMISEKKYLNIISNLPCQQKKTIYYSYLWAGMDYTVNKKYKGKGIETVLPLISKTLKK